MALINIVEESDLEIIPSSCPSFIGKPNEPTLLKEHSSNLNGFVHSSSKEGRIVAAHSYFNDSRGSKKRVKKKSFSFINELSQNLSQSQESEIFWSLPTLTNNTNCTPTKDNKKHKNYLSSDTHSFKGKSSPPANDGDSCIYGNNNKKHSFNADINNFSLSHLKKTCKMRIDDRKLYTEACAANLGNEVSESLSEVFKKRIPNSVISSSKEHSGEFQSPEILSQNAVLEIENKNSCILNNVNAESASPFSCDLFDSNLVTAPITEELHTVKGKLSPFKVNNAEAVSSHQINSKKGQSLQILTNEINGLINHTNKTFIERESSSKILEGEKSNDARFSSKKCSENDNPMKKQQKKKLKYVSNEVHSSPEKANGFDNSPKKLRNKKVDDGSDGYASPEKVTGFEHSPKKLRNEKVDVVSDGYTRPEKVNGFDNSPKKLRNKKVDNGSDGYTSPEKVNGFDNSPKKLRNKKVDDVSDGYISPEKVIGFEDSPKKLRNEKVDDVSDGYISPEKVTGFEDSPKKLRNEKVDVVSDGYTSPEKVNGFDNSPKKLRNKKVDDGSDGYTSPEKVTGFEDSPKKLRNGKVYDVSDGYTSSEKVNRWDNSPKKILNKKIGDDHFSPKKDSGYDDISTPEKVTEYDRSPKKGKDETSSNDLSSVEKVNRCDRSPNKVLNKKHYNRISGEDLSGPETVIVDDKPMKKQRKEKLGIANDELPKPKIIDQSCLEKRDENYNDVKKQCCINLEDEGSKEGNSSLEIGNENENPSKNLRNPDMMNTPSSGYHCRPKIVSETEYCTKKQRHNKLVNKTLIDDDSSTDKVAKTDYALRIQRNTRSKNKRSIDQYSQPEIVSLSEYRAKKQRNSEQMDSASSNCRSSSENNINERDSALREQSTKKSIGQDSNPDVVSKFEGRTKKQRKNKLVDSKSSDCCSSLENNVNESDSALREQSNKRSIDQYSRPEIVSEFEDRTKKQWDNELVERASTDHHSSLVNKDNGNGNTPKKQRRRNGKLLDGTSNDDQTGTDGVKDINFCNSESEINDFQLILLKEDIPLTDTEIYCLRRKLAKAYTLSEELCNKLKNLDIKITWKLSEIHRDYNFLHNGEFSYADKSDLRRTKVKEGPFEPEENEAIMNRWNTFCKLYNFNVLRDFRGFLPRSYDHKKPHPLTKYEKLKFVQFLAKDLPDRLLHAVYAHFVGLLKNYNKGRFSTEEDDWLLFFKKYSRNRRIYAILSSLLHRSRYTIYRRMKILNSYGDLEMLTFGDTFSNNRNEKNIDPQEGNKLRVSLCSSSRCYDNETLRKTIAHLTGSEDIEKWDSFTANISCWRRIGKKCKIPPVEAKLQYLCNLRINSLPHKIPPTSYLQKRIIYRLKKYEWKHWKSINWNLLSEELFHLGSVFLYVTFRRYVKKNVPSEFWGKLTDCLNYIEQNDNQNNIKPQNEDIYEYY